MRTESLFLTLAILGSGLVAGVFLAFSTFVLRALNQLPPAQAVQAMQNINVTVITPLFMIALFGTGLLCACLGYGIYRGTIGLGSQPVAFGIVFYLVGAIAVTLFCNVPLNNELANVSAGETNIAQSWQGFYGPWLFWNHVRTVASILACLSFVRAIAVQ